MRMGRTAALMTATTLAACLSVTDASAVDKVFKTEKAMVSVKTVASGLSHPWGLAFLPDGRMLVTEKDGRLRIVAQDGTVSAPVKGVPKVDDRGQGGLLDVALDPDFAQNRFVYLSYSEPGTQDGTNSTAVARGALNADETALTDVRVIFSQKPKVESRMHYGSRLVFDRQGHLYVTLGERSLERFRTQAQDLDSHLGKVVRINRDGSVPADNPFVNRSGALPEIWSYGHRNIQGAALNPQTGALWINEHGPRGGDEVNVPEAGKNYGWPVVSYGVNYNGTPIGTGKSSAPGMEEPVYQWTPVIGSSGMTFYTADTLPGWKGSVFNGGLATKEVVRLELDGNKVKHEERMFRDLGKRIRQVSQGPDGALYLLTDENRGEILRVTPAGKP
ncbi:PQQ-dependent sugar dehydrogenase [Azospirillum tabaci]|uniref:PQQ-dependent sugar dehydrogenase n=1 Tax=Azospirillum tabaci TaxID=2752310 RepID=UPI001FEAEAF4|nr:PQQ-dependent sugar dehydrogenase [Azospirillum tabaci]